MAILLQYNTEDVYTVQQLTDSTQIKIVSISHHPYFTKHLFDIFKYEKVMFFFLMYIFFFILQDILVQVLQILLKSKLLVSYSFCAEFYLKKEEKKHDFDYLHFFCVNYF